VLGAKPTAVQSEAIPHIVNGKDVVISSPTGTGKTGAFVLPLLQSLAKDREGSTDEEVQAGTKKRSPSILVLSPTRDLALQTSACFSTVAEAARLPLTARTVCGGVSINPQLLTLQYGVDAVVATPGRLLAVLASNGTDISAVTRVVLDEADRLLAGEFLADTEAVLRAVGPAVQTVAVSATYSKTSKARVDSLLRPGYARVGLDDHEDTNKPDISYAVRRTTDKKKHSLLVKSLLADPQARTLVFVGTKSLSTSLAKTLEEKGVPAADLNGDLSMGARASRLSDFKRGTPSVLVATDVAARGIDIPGIARVVHYDLPRSPTAFRHRSGRTGRAGEAGEAVSFVTVETEAHYAVIERKNKVEAAAVIEEGFEVDEARWEKEREAIKAKLGGEKEAGERMSGGVKSLFKKSKKDKIREAKLNTISARTTERRARNKEKKMGAKGGEGSE